MIDIWRLDHSKILLQAIDVRDGYDKNLPREKKRPAFQEFHSQSHSQSHQIDFRMPQLSSIQIWYTDILSQKLFK